MTQWNTKPPGYMATCQYAFTAAQVLAPAVVALFASGRAADHQFQPACVRVASASSRSHRPPGLEIGRFARAHASASVSS